MVAPLKPQVGDLVIIDQPDRYEHIWVGYITKSYMPDRKQRKSDAANYGVTINWIEAATENVTFHDFAHNVVIGLYKHVVNSGIRVSKEIDTTEQDY